MDVINFQPNTDVSSHNLVSINLFGERGKSPFPCKPTGLRRGKLSWPFPDQSGLLQKSAINNTSISRTWQRKRKHFPSDFTYLVEPSSQQLYEVGRAELSPLLQDDKTEAQILLRLPKFTQLICSADDRTWSWFWPVLFPSPRSWPEFLLIATKSDLRGLKGAGLMAPQSSPAPAPPAQFLKSNFYMPRHTTNLWNKLAPIE